MRVPSTLLSKPAIHAIFANNTQYAMERTVQYYYPDEASPASLKVFQDQSSQIRAIRFTRDRIDEARTLENASNYAIYFLFSQDDESNRPVIYIGQSKNGVGRINNHNQYKDFWSYCILFVSDNNAFDMNAIDYMEYYFIHKLLQSKTYQLENKDTREKAPNISTFNRTTYDSYIKQIEFLLLADGIRLDAPTKSPTLKSYPLRGNDTCRIYYKEGAFVLESGAVIIPYTSSSTVKSTRQHIARQQKQLGQFVSEGKLEQLDNGSYRSTSPISFSSPSGVSSFLLGHSSNGWDAFIGVEELRRQLEGLDA